MGRRGRHFEVPTPPGVANLHQAGRETSGKWETDRADERWVSTHCAFCGVQCGMHLRVAGGEADQRVGGVEAGHHHLAHFAGRQGVEQVEDQRALLDRFGADTLRVISEESALLLIDVQERLAPAIHEVERVTENVAKLIAGARRLEVPVLATEHCPEAIGSTLPELRAQLQDEEIYGKRHFGACAEAGFREKVARAARHQWVLCGTEAHVCLLQAALGLRVVTIEGAPSGHVSPRNPMKVVPPMVAIAVGTGPAGSQADEPDSSLLSGIPKKSIPPTPSASASFANATM